MLRIFDGLLRLVVPDRCRLCGLGLEPAAGSGLCSRCLAAIGYMGDTVCRCCGGLQPHPIAAGMLCGGCLRQPPPWDMARSVVRYDREVRELLLRLKYRADTSVLPALARIVEPQLAAIDWPCDLVVPVPLHSSRLKSRGLNQALAIAGLLLPARRQRLAPTLLVRTRATVPQTGLDGVARRRNLRGAFTVASPELVTGARVTLVDDVFTTGTTLAECCRVLRRAGAAEIRALTLARVVTHLQDSSLA
jgi:ComF family protein